MVALCDSICNNAVISVAGFSCSCSKKLFFLMFYYFFLHGSSVGYGWSRVVLPPEPQRTGGSTGSTGSGAWGAEGGVWEAENFACKAGGGAEEAEAAGQRSGGLHRHAAGAHHGAEAHPPASAIQVQVRRVLQLSPHLFTLTSTTSSLVFSLLCCPFWYKYLGTERCRGRVFLACFTGLVEGLVLNVAGSQVVFRFTQTGGFSCLGSWL